MAAQLNPSDPAYHMDWIFGSGSNVHYASRKEWFTTFTSFDSACYSGTGSPLKVNGIGTVKLRVKKRDGSRDSRDTGILILQDALYTPTSYCNLIGSPIMDEYDFHNRKGKNGPYGFHDRTTGRQVALLGGPHKLWRLKLKGQSATQSILEKSVSYSFFNDWPDSGRLRWQELKAISSEAHHAQPSVALVVPI